MSAGVSFPFFVLVTILPNQCNSMCAAFLLSMKDTVSQQDPLPLSLKVLPPSFQKCSLYSEYLPFHPHMSVAFTLHLRSSFV